MNPARHLDPLQDLTPITLDEITTIADLQTRRDRKYLIDRTVAEELVAGLAPDVSILTIDGTRSFRYESVYFDTPELVSYLGAARRRPRRFKVRTRSYLDVDQCLLEVKTRDPHGRTIKHRYPYDIDERDLLTADGRCFIAQIDQAAIVVDRLVPTLTTSYQRATLVLPDSTARVTIDIDVTCQQPDGCSTSIRDLALIETKTSGAPCAVDRALWRTGHRPVTISKYCTGLAALRPDLPANKWHRVLQRHFNSLSETYDHQW